MEDRDSTASFHILSESRLLSVVLFGGDILTISLDDELPSIDFVGSVESGIKAACWSSDETFLILVNGDGTLIQMTRDFDVIYEAPLQASDFGEEKQSNVGWGSKSTQFHGSLGKSAASAASMAVGSSPDDDAMPRITWRGDATYFAVSSLEGVLSTPIRRVIRVYSPSPSLSLISTTEPIPGLEHPLSWNPTGSLIASTQRFGSNNAESGLGAGREGRHDVILFERNGLRRNSFEIAPIMQWKYRVVELSWSSDSSVLAVWICSETSDVIQLWTMGNYHWWVHAFSPSVPAPGAAGRLTNMSWHPENALILDLISSDIVVRLKLAWETCASRLPPPVETGSVAVIDGGNILITPFSTQNVPPPMSSYRIEVTHPAKLPFTTAPTHIALSHSADLLAVLHHDGGIGVWNLRTNLTPPHMHKGNRKDYNVANPIQLWERTGTEDIRGSSSSRQIALYHRETASAVDESWGDVIHLYLPGGQATTIVLQTFGSGCLVVAPVGIWFENVEGVLHEVDVENGVLLSSSKRLASFAFGAVSFTPGGTEEPIFVGLSQTDAKLLSSSPGLPSIAEHVSSFTITPSHIVYIGASHEAHFVRLSLLCTNGSGAESGAPDGSITPRRVERGSRIVVAVSSLMNLVLQMPRGNLETIYPRAFVMDVIRADISSRRYRKAFLACRKHRVDFNVFVSHDSQAFVSDIGEFVKQVHEVDHLNLFLANIGRASPDTPKINDLCDAIRSYLEAKDLVGYINSVLTAYVVKTPPELESALGSLARLKAQNPEVLEEAVKYLIFLVDANTLFDTALGMYDFPLTLLVAQHSQRDPREYIPFLRELRGLPSAYQRFRIDDHLKRHAKALIGLCGAGLEKFEEALSYIERHKLFDDALRVWSGHPDHIRIYGDHQFERREFSPAALSFTLAGHWKKAMVAHERAHDWKEALCAAFHAGLSQGDTKDLHDRLIDDLLSRKRHCEAARAMLDYSKDIEGAVLALVQGNEVSEAYRVAYLHAKPELVTTIIHPNVLVLREEIGDEIDEARDQLAKQSSRFVELQRKKLEEPGQLHLCDAQSRDVEVMTDAGDSVAPTTFTRYTAAPSVTPPKSNRSTKKGERKRGKKGTVDEEAYILASTLKLVSRLDTFRSECVKLLPHLAVISEEHMREARALQATLLSFERGLEEAITFMWPSQAPISEHAISPLPKPSLTAGTWSIKSLNVK
ncbi:IKI3 family-domain-containing protein [Cantharellus anzutake]|uniref:IKI3 family-domain-containing protein n=1 Tax=Cantharellus anzutake TaxID=1750568 RepID=UPI001906474D|nr:IKI3 family-domain-containing protein [Cantharellus anzutake]KAF8340348.1 IKI3 family-domain-containing protein [Cantharellus anzutake]